MTKGTAISPCYMCADRAADCHAKCEKYRTWHLQRVEMLEAIYAEKSIENAVYESNLNRRLHMTSGNRGKMNRRSLYKRNRKMFHR